MTTRSYLSPRVLAVVASAALVVAPMAVARPAGGCASGAVVAGPYWTSIRAPEFPSGDTALTAYSVVPTAPSVLFATNGTSVMRTTDRGCGWAEVFALPDVPTAEYGYSAATSRITRIVIPQARPARHRVLLLIEEAAGHSRAHVVRSDDGGNEWAPADSGLPPAGRPEALRIAPGDPDVVYLGLDLGDGAIDLLYASSDGGATWSLRSSPSSTNPGAGLTGIAVDPLASEELWAWGTGGLFHSTDGGTTFTPVDEFAATEVNLGAVWHERGQPAVVVAFRPATNDLLGSGDGGANWLRVGTPRDVQSVADGRDALNMLIAAGGAVYAYHAPSFAWIELNGPRKDIVDLSADRARRADFYGRTDATIEVYTGPSAGPPLVLPPDDLPDVPLLGVPSRPAPAGPPRLAPDGREVVLGPGESRTLTYRLDLPKKRVPLDVYFLIDTSDSMDALIAGLVRSIAAIIDGLHSQGIDVQFGIGEYRAYPDSQIPRVAEPNFVYRRVRDIAPFSASLQAALESLVADAGGRFESHLPALLQTATGEGEEVYPPGPSSSDVPPGRQANFRAKALRVVIHATDSEFGRQEQDENFGSDFGRLTAPVYPTFAEVIDALNERDILHVGLGVGSPAHPPRNPYLRGFPTTMSDLQRMARATGALAPGGGVDCDGDGVTDIGAGEPLACPLGRRNLDGGGTLVSPIVNLVKAVRDYAAISLVPRRGGAVVAGVRPRAQEVALQSAGTIDFKVTYSCPAGLVGQTIAVSLQATAGGLAPLDRVTTTVVCRPGVSPFALGPLLILVVPPPPPPPPATSASTAAQSQAQAQFGFVAQEQKQAQLAYVQVSNPGLREQVAEEYAMSGLNEPEGVPPERTLAAGAVLLSFMYACLGRARQQVARVARVGRNRR